ncbi:MAG: efflux RND transporter periplasmic adaptor subunit [Bacteroidota bacterium]|nr:efflux RND transporter periplasmic adaptor subunit [Bacteroidota bacterium]
MKYRNSYISKILLFSISNLLFSCIITSCKTNKTDENNNKAFCLTDTMARVIRIDTVKMENVKSELMLTGKVSFDEDEVIKIYPMVSGSVDDIKVELGDYVEKGQILAVIKSGEIAGYEHQLIAAESNLQISKKNMDVAKDMYKSGINSEREFITVQKEYQKAEAELKRIKEVYKIYNIDKESNSIIRSPISGFIVEKKLNSGMHIRPDNTENIFTISALKDVWVIANVYQTDIDKIKTDLPVNVKTIAYPDKSWDGKIDKIYSLLDPVTKVMKIRIKLNNPDYKLKPGMFTNVFLHFTENIAMNMIPSTSVIFDRSKNYVMVYKGKCNIETREINVFRSVDKSTYVSSGLKTGEMIISRNQLLVYDEIND